MKTKTFSIMAIFLLGLTSLPASSAIILDFNPSSPYPVTSGDIFNVDVVISGLGSEIVAAYDLDVGFDSSILQANSIVFGPWLGDEFFFEVFNDAILNNVAGLVDFAALSLLSDGELSILQATQGGTLTLATLNFTALKDGTTPLAFLWGEGNDVKGANNREIYPAPEPGSLLLLAFGGAMSVMRRRELTGKQQNHN